jgi:hypothetical protein
VGGQGGVQPSFAAELSGWVTSSGIGHQLPLGLGSPGALDPAGPVTLAAVLAILLTVLGARVVVELHSESHAAKPSARAWAITRRAQRAQHRVVLRAADPLGQLPPDRARIGSSPWLCRQRWRPPKVVTDVAANPALLRSRLHHEDGAATRPLATEGNR